MLIEAEDVVSLRLAFGKYGRNVPERPRCTEDREAWCLRRYLLTLAEFGRLSFPLRVIKFETPDYKVEGATNFGIEVTEATSSCDQREMAEFEKNCRKSGSVGFVGFGGRGRDGWVGNDPELSLINDIESSLVRKSNNPWKCQPVRLLIYPNSNASVVACCKETARILHRDIDRQRFGNFGSAFSEVSVIAECELWFDILGEFSRLSLVES